MVDSFGKLPAELRFTIMSHAPDPKTLFNLSVAYPNLVPELERTAQVLIPGVISRSMSTELEQLVNAILTVRANPSIVSQVYPYKSEFLEYYAIQADWSTNILYNLEFLTNIQSAIEFFAQGFIRKQMYSDKEQDSELPTRTEMERIHRALWRIEFCCKLQQIRAPSAHTRSRRLFSYLVTITPWEAEELECVYDYLAGFLLGDADMDQNLESSDAEVSSRLRKLVYPTPTYHRNSRETSRVLSRGLVSLYKHSPLPNTDHQSRKLEDSQSWADSFIRQAFYEAALDREPIPVRLKKLIIGDVPKARWSFEDADASLPNVGWRFVHPFMPNKTSMQRRPFKYLHRWGYFIWDAKRFMSLGLLSGKFSNDDHMLLRVSNCPYLLKIAQENTVQVK
ncbi:hypothetical protein N7G274_007343 [Stereocaulon virgatum]|uniref:F-box domain-containing protein n=1 Tax=Stereocaulon virgatum TaxID=373712 RepID=A0ABR4A3C2_9LECA